MGNLNLKTLVALLTLLSKEERISGTLVELQHDLMSEFLKRSDKMLSAVDYAWKELTKLDKIKAIKTYRDFYGVSLKESKDAVEHYMNNPYEIPGR